MDNLKANKTFKIKKAKTLIVKHEDIKDLKDKQEKLKEEFYDLQYKLFAEGRRSLLIVFQGMDASGKDGLIKYLMEGLNPQGVQVTSFKHPTSRELSHDFIWRHYLALPEKGSIGIFNRSHYENVLISRVHTDLILAEKLPLEIEKKRDTNGFWNARFERINSFEKNIAGHGTKVIKFFLHLSKAEQKQRFLKRVEDRERHWKFSTSDIEERAYWNDYMNAYEKCIQATSTRDNPWYVLPADDKKSCRYIALQIIVEELRKMKPKFPATNPKQEKLFKKVIKELK